MAESFHKAPLATGMRCRYPVVLSVPAHLRNLRGRPQVAILSRLARVAVRWSAHLTGVGPPAFTKDGRGTPQPSAGIHWSVTHKPAFVAGVATAAPVGIDIERMRTPAEGLYRRIASAEEWRLGLGMARPRLFYRLWTAKEAVLKAEGLGLRGLSRCRVIAIPDREHMLLAFDQRRWAVDHYYLPGHVVALTPGGEDIEWQVDPAWPQRC
jgi:4'-phosphopantetheinyl transferase